MQKMQWCRRSRTGLGRGELRLIRPQIGNLSEYVRAAPLVAIAAFLLTACTTTPEPQIVVKEVKIPVMVPCPIDTTEPAYVDTLDALRAAASKGSDAVVALMIGGRAQRDALIAGLKAQAGECGG